jgi:hypothetical protein
VIACLAAKASLKPGAVAARESPYSREAVNEMTRMQSLFQPLPADHHAWLGEYRRV